MTGHSHSIQTKPTLYTFNSFSDTRPVDSSNSLYGSQQWTSLKHPTAELTGLQSQDLLQLCCNNGNNDKGISSFLADNQSYMSTSAPASASVSYLYHQSHYPSNSHQNQDYFGQPVQSENIPSVTNYFVQEPVSPKSTNLVFTWRKKEKRFILRIGNIKTKNSRKGSKNKKQKKQIEGRVKKQKQKDQSFVVPIPIGDLTFNNQTDHSSLYFLSFFVF